jgi:hypothetical protein
MRRQTQIETFWCRPRWQLAQALNLVLAFAGSLVAVTAPWAGVALAAAGLASLIADWQLGISPGRLLTGERASQNVVSQPPRRAPVTLVLAAGYDAPRGGLAQRLLPASFGGFGWLAWLTVLVTWVLATALIRTGGAHGTLLGVLQLLPTVALVLAIALLLDVAIAPPREDRSAADTAVKLLRALDAAPPTNLAVELVLGGASAGYGLGIRSYLRARRRQQDRTNTVVLGIGPSEPRETCYLNGDGPLLPLGFFRALRQLAQPLAKPIYGHGCSAALPARMRGLPAISLTGGPEADRMQAALLLIEAIDTYLGELRRA